MATPAKRLIAVFNRPRDIGDFLIKAEEIVKKIGDNSGLFPAPSPDPATVKLHIKDLVKAESVAKTRLQGASSERDQFYAIVLKDLLLLLGYVQTLADKATSIIKAEEIIKSSGFNVKARAVRFKAPLKAKPGKIARTVALLAKAVTGNVRAAYDWQQSTDALNWHNLTATPKAKTTTGTLAQGLYFFRVKSSTSKTESEWSEPVHIFVFE